MKVFFVAFLAFASFACAEILTPGLADNPAYGYLTRVAIPEAERILRAVESTVESIPTSVGQYEYQVGLMLSIVGFDGIGICSGAIISANRIITAAHCWFDGRNQVWRVLVVPGLTNGANVIESNVAFVHPDWFPQLLQNDVAIIYLPSSIPFSDTLGPVSLPSGAELTEDFAGEFAVVSAFGFSIGGGGSANVQVITNSICANSVPGFIQPTNMCTVGNGEHCRSISGGGPLIVTRDNRRILIGVVSFGLAAGCSANNPHAYARVTSFIDFINKHH